MKLKSFFANTIEEAIRLARHEMGPEAMLVNSKRAGVEARHLGLYEVVVCGEAQKTGPKDPAHGQERDKERNDKERNDKERNDKERNKDGSGAVAASLPADRPSQ